MITDFSILVRNYGLGVSNFDVSPFESLNTLHTRSNLEKSMKHLTNEEKVELHRYDMVLIQNAKEMCKHIESVYDFLTSKEPVSEWWWHLDQVAKGDIRFKLITDVNTDTDV